MSTNLTKYSLEDFKKLVKSLDIKPGNIYQVSYSNLDTNSLLPFKISYWEYNKNDFLWSWHSFERNDIFTILDLDCYCCERLNFLYSNIIALLGGKQIAIIEPYVNVGYKLRQIIKLSA